MTQLEFNKLEGYIGEIVTNFSWYSDLRYPNHIDIKSLPFITSEILEQHYYLTPATEEMIVYRTSGTSSGKRKQILYNESDEERYLENKTKIFLTAIGLDFNVGHSKSEGEL